LPNITQFAEHWEFARCCDIMSKVCLYNMRIYDMRACILDSRFLALFVIIVPNVTRFVSCIMLNVQYSTKVKFNTAWMPHWIGRQNHTVWVKKNPRWGVLTFFIFVTNGWKFLIDFFTHLLYVPIYARLQIFIQLYPILTKLSHIKRDYPVHIICSKCSPSAEMHALTRLRKSLTALLIVVCGK